MKSLKKNNALFFSKKFHFVMDTFYIYIVPLSCAKLHMLLYAVLNRQATRFFVHCFNLLYDKENIQLFHLKMASEGVCSVVHVAFTRFSVICRYKR